MKAEIAIVGVDCATEASRVGLSLGIWSRGVVQVREVVVCSRVRSPETTIIRWLKSWHGPSLLALDAPLGWPTPLAQALADHRAGMELNAAPDEMFRRSTDRFIKRTVGKTPLDVGAARIARTAHAALQLLGEIRLQLNAPIPLVWSGDSLAGVGAIEVYPAATLMAHGCRSSGYKKPGDVAERREIIEFLRTSMKIPTDVRQVEHSADALDAVVCLLAAQDFLEGRALPPPEQRLAEQEGWIWSAAQAKEG